MTLKGNNEKIEDTCLEGKLIVQKGNNDTSDINDKKKQRRNGKEVICLPES